MRVKTLTISIAGYNVEKFIEAALNSLCADAIISELEIFIIDDGGKDNTLKIAEKYANKYPFSIFPIHKDNGGWGSTVNYSISHATGKYFKILDGDDLFSTDSLVRLVSILKKIDADVIYTPYRRFDDESGNTIEICDTATTNDKYVVMTSDKLPSNIDFSMHSVTFRTELLKKNHIRVSEKCFYTDNEYRTKGIAYAKTFYLTNEEVYQYRVGRTEQSIGLTGLRKHYRDCDYVMKTLISFYKNLNTKLNLSYVKKYTKNAIEFNYNTLLALNMKSELKELDAFIKNNCVDLYNTNSLNIKLLRKTSFNGTSALSNMYRFRLYMAPKFKIILRKLKHL